MEQFSVKAIRTQMNLTQEEMSNLLGMAVSTYQAKEQGRFEFDACEIYKICFLAGIKVDKIEPPQSFISWLKSDGIRIKNEIEG